MPDRILSAEEVAAMVESDEALLEASCEQIAALARSHELLREKLEAAGRQLADAERERDAYLRRVDEVNVARQENEVRAITAEAALARATEALEKIRNSMAGKTYNEVDSTTVAALANEALAAVSSQPAGVWLSHDDAETVHAGLTEGHVYELHAEDPEEDEQSYPDCPACAALALLGGKAPA